MREVRTSGSMSGSVETEHGRRILRHTRGNPETEVSRSLNHRATSRLYRPSQVSREIQGLQLVIGRNLGRTISSLHEGGQRVLASKYLGAERRQHSTGSESRSTEISSLACRNPPDFLVIRASVEFSNPMGLNIIRRLAGREPFTFLRRLIRRVSKPKGGANGIL